MGPISTLCVFCGANPGRVPAHVAAARRLGALLADAGIGLVYGGASVGTMGELADAALERGGRVVGVIPEHQVADEIAHDGLTELHVVGSMHERKAMMAELSDGFVTLPGGIGTLEEFAEALTWSQLGLHAKPVGLLNTAGYYRDLLAFFDHAVAEGFLRAADRALVRSGPDPETLLAELRAAPAPADRRWRPVGDDR
ncbi:TIGR00730 family Rossman fold protein [Pseudonocardia sp. NPDC046786]|uniref:LOG family protein n=1 Tax=Pseudonocardia sp. NPDC046786 TaxID=3155471 RepID=UPI0033F440D7